MATKLDGVGGGAVAAGKALLTDILRDAYHTAGVKWEQGMTELANAMYQGTPVPIPQNLTLSQIERGPVGRGDLMRGYEQQLGEAHDRAAEQPREHDRGIEK